jgi:hypothetical protein
VGESVFGDDSLGEEVKGAEILDLKSKGTKKAFEQEGIVLGKLKLVGL